MQNSPLLIAVVDDEESIRRALQRLLRSVGYSVETFATGGEFLASLVHREPHCAIVDLHMPGIDGWEIQERLARRVPVVIITGHDTGQARAQAMERGAKAYLRKPFDDTALLDAIEHALANGHEAHGQHCVGPWSN